MCQIEADILMGFKRAVTQVNEDNDDDNDIYLTPSFQRTLLVFYLIFIENLSLEL